MSIVRRPAILDHLGLYMLACRRGESEASAKRKSHARGGACFVPPPLARTTMEVASS